MHEAITAMLAGRRNDSCASRWAPRVFFLNAADHAEFMATKPPYGRYSTFVGGHPDMLELPFFEGVAVRKSSAKLGSKGKFFSILYSYAGTTKKVKDA